MDPMMLRFTVAHHSWDLISSHAWDLISNHAIHNTRGLVELLITGDEAAKE